MARVSIVVPIYNVEKHLDRCVQSILSQTFRDIEIILVDDGSLDHCLQMCDNYAQQDDRIKVVHKENGGLSSARNAGIDAATGQFIGFVDADDSIVPQMYERMVNMLENYHVDFVMADYIGIPVDGSSFLKTLDIREGYYSKEDIRREIFPSLIMGENLDYGPLLSVCHCMYNLDFLREHHLRFDEEVRWSEDNIFSAVMGYLANGFFYLKGEGLYYYYQNGDTITTSYKEGAWETYCTMNDHLHLFFDQEKEYDFSQQMNLHMVYYACVCLNQTIMLSKERQKKEVKHILDSAHLRKAVNGLRLPTAHIKLKIQVFLIKHRLKWLLSLMINRHRHIV